jgi:hypothetical protein
MKKFVCTLTVLSLVTLAGCLEYKEEVKLNKDGSGSTHLRFAVNQAYLQQMEEMSKMMAQMSGGDAEPVELPSIVSSEEKIRAFFKEIKSGAQLDSYEVSETDNSRVWNLSFTFSNLLELDYINASVFQSEDDDMGEDSLSADHQPTVSFVKQDNGAWLFTRTMPENDIPGDDMDMGMNDGYPAGEYDDGEYADESSVEEDDEESSEFGAEIEKGLGKFVEGIEQAVGGQNKPVFTLSVTFAGEVIESNATDVAGNTATWAFTMEQISAQLTTMTATVKD